MSGLFNKSNSFDKKLLEKYKNQAMLAVKDEYSFDFLGLEFSEYVLQDTKKPMGVATYKIKKDLPRNVNKFLPTPEEISKRLAQF